MKTVVGQGAALGYRILLFLRTRKSNAVDTHRLEPKQDLARRSI